MAGGIVAKRSGNFFESDFDLSLRHYQNRGQAIGHPNYPESKRIKGNRAIIVGMALPDRSIVLKGGHAVLVDIKSFNTPENQRYHLLYQKKGKTVQTRMNQFEKMIEFSKFDTICFYVVAFHHEKLKSSIDHIELDWRLYPVLDRERLPQFSTPKFGPETAIQFTRKLGYQIPITDGWPDWIRVIKNFL